MIEPRITVSHLEARLRAVGIKWLLVDDDHRPDALSAADRHPLCLVQFSPGGGGGSYFDEALQPEDDALLLFTSGSTGKPKGVLLSHRNLLANATGIIERTAITANDRLLHVMPLHHTNGINNQILAPFLVGASVALMEKFRAQEIYGQITAYRPTFLTGVPTMFSRMLAEPWPLDGVSGLRFLRCGSAPLSDMLHEQIEARFGVPLVVSYGLSEATCTSLMNPPSNRKIGSVGTPLSGQRVVLSLPGSPVNVEGSDEGEICIGGPTVMKGYIPPDGDMSERVFENGWIRTGDLGRCDPDGYFSVTGRLKDVIIRGGENVSPQAVECALLSHPSVGAAAVIGIPDPDLGEVPVAFVTNSNPLDANSIKDHVRLHLGASYTPAHVFFVGPLPENAIGKIDTPRLRRMACARLGIALSESND
jgi:acyl-CoA synthetase (AMP-forming)/AMP-acid ligase II